MTEPDPERELRESWSMGRLRPWLTLLAQRELPESLRGSVEASDVVQQTLLQAWRAESDFRGETHAQRLAWLRTIMKNTIRDQQRHILQTAKRGGAREHKAADLSGSLPGQIEQIAVSSAPSVSTNLEHAEETLQLAERLQQLPDDQRAVVVHRHFDEMSHAEIAAKLQRSVPAVRMLWVRALKNLQLLSVENEEPC